MAACAIQALAVALVGAPMAAHEIVVGTPFEHLDVYVVGRLDNLLAVAPTDPRSNKGRNLHIALVSVAVGKLYGVGGYKSWRVVMSGKAGKLLLQRGVHVVSVFPQI